MKTEEYINALERIKAMQRRTEDAIAWLLGVLKGDAYKAKKMPETPFTMIRATT